MKLTLLKIFSLFSFMTITLVGEHVGGPMILLILMGLFSDNFYSICTSGFIITGVIYWIFSAVTKNPKLDKALLPIASLPFFVPIGHHISYILENSKWISSFGLIIFILTALLFVLSLVLTFVYVLQEPRFFKANEKL
jgi:hypothetical protein